MPIRLYIILITLLPLGVSGAHAQSASLKLPRDLVAFFQGTWHGKGEFANGKPIEAELSFHIALDSSWISYTHDDVAPAIYHAQSMWGIDKTSGEFFAYLFDNFQGHRKFEGNGWEQDKLILTSSSYEPKAGLMFQQFIYEKQSDSSFKMTYEISRDARSWRMVDYLIFNKK